MERVRLLIQKLQEQERAGASPAQLLQTVQELHAALGALQQSAALPAGGRIAVMMPGLSATATPSAEQPAPPVATRMPEPVTPPPTPPVAEEPTPEPVPETPRAEPVTEAPQPAPVPEPAPAPAYEPPPAYTPPPTPPPPAYVTPTFNPLEEVPTLAQQAPPQKELHKALGETPTSLNEKLKQEHVELGKKLTGGPIKDLRKGISLNDRYLFISELFRGDEAMYERSIKTINGFHILPEAEYWINRELKLKLGWPEASDTVAHFDQLVRRRFS